MNDNEEATPIEAPTFWTEHRFLLLIVSSIVIALGLVSVSMALYTSSGAAQLDLSRPGYRAVTSQAITTDKDFEEYSAFGSLDENAINDFRTIYDKQSAKAKAVDAFNGDPLDPEALGISAPTASE